MINTRVHGNHGIDPSCEERIVDPASHLAPDRLRGTGQLRGDCLEDDGCERGAHLGYSLIRRSAGCQMPTVTSTDEPDGVNDLELEATPRRASLVGVLTDMMVLLDTELDDLAEVRRTTDRQIASDAEHVIDKLNVVWAKMAEARTAVRSCDLGYLPLPEAP